MKVGRDEQTVEMSESLPLSPLRLINSAHASLMALPGI